MQRQASAAEDYVRRLESRGSAAAVLEIQGDEDDEQDDQGFSGIKVVCRLCFSGENEGSKKAANMLACKNCSKKYHRSCLKNWAAHRDLFHWSSWTCPSCRTCEVCRQVGDPNKFMYCKRCDGAYHCYCQQPPHKNVSHGPYLCPKHTKCHSCGSTVPGSGHSTRWFLGYTCCDACGRLFVKGNYCPVCLKVYRDSEVIPMVCCDMCEKWVHIQCDGISEDKYQEFQADQNLQYTCAACRGECYQIRDTEDAVRELWKRRDMADYDLTTSLRAAVGLPPLEVSSPSRYSDDEKVGPIIVKNENRKTLKFSFKTNIDKSSVTLSEQEKSTPKNSSSSKKPSKKKGHQDKMVADEDEIYLERKHGAKSSGITFRNQIADDKTSVRNNGIEAVSSSVTLSAEKDVTSSLPLPSKNIGSMKKLIANNVDMVPKVKIKGVKLPSLHLKDTGTEYVGKNDSGRGTKLVIHIGSKDKRSNGSPRSGASSFQREETASMDGGKVEAKSQMESVREEMKGKGVMKLERSAGKLHRNSNLLEDLSNTKSRATGKRSNITVPGADTASEYATTKVSGQKHSMNMLSNQQRENKGKPSPVSASNSSNDQKPLLKLKFKGPCLEQQSEQNSVKGPRSKRKRTSMEKTSASEDENSAKRQHQSSIDEAIDANWILEKLGKGAIGKRVEVHLSSDGSWQKGVVSDVIEGTSALAVRLDNGRSETVELGKQSIRFIAHKKKGEKT